MWCYCVYVCEREKERGSQTQFSPGEGPQRHKKISKGKTCRVTEQTSIQITESTSNKKKYNIELKDLLHSGFKDNYVPKSSQEGVTIGVKEAIGTYTRSIRHKNTTRTLI